MKAIIFILKNDDYSDEVEEAIHMAISALTKEAWKEEHPVSPLLQKLATNLQPSKQDDLIAQEQLSNNSPELDKENGELM